MRLAAAILLLLAAPPALAAPEGSWPQDMRGYSLPRQDWIMIIPATREQDGSVSVWNRDDPWNRSWRVPRPTPSGTRTVAVNGDSEDMRIVSPGQIDNMSVGALSKLAAKYGASSIAVVVEDDAGDVAVAAWARGNYATWEATPGYGDPREAALDVLDGIFSGAEPPPSPEASGDDTVSIVGQRPDASAGGMEYRITGRPSALDRIAASTEFRINRRNDDVPPSVDVTVLDGRDVEEALARAGVRLR